MKQNAILQQTFFWYKVHDLVCAGGVNWSMWFIVTASNWIRQLRFGHLPLQHALVKGKGLSYFYCFVGYPWGKTASVSLASDFIEQGYCMRQHQVLVSA